MAPRIEWSNIDQSSINLEKLKLLSSSEKALKTEGYVTKPLTPDAILSKLRCKLCEKRMKLPVEQKPETMATAGRFRSRPKCEFHPGRVVNLHFTCCQAHVSMKKGCHVNIEHTAPDDYLEPLKLDWTYHTTPPRSASAQPAANMTSSARRRNRGARCHNLTYGVARKAIALDCEFGQSIHNDPELIRISAVDFFTRQVLINSLVKPDVYIKDFMTRYSGVTAAQMRDAVRQKQCIFGRDAARQKLFEFVDKDTVMVMHGGSSDMTSLRWMHPRIIDTHIVEKYFESLIGGRSLKNLCEKKLGIKIQMGRGHDSLEDAMACRELLIAVMNMIPDE